MPFNDKGEFIRSKQSAAGSATLAKAPADSLSSRDLYAAAKAMGVLFAVAALIWVVVLLREWIAIGVICWLIQAVRSWLQ
jgi:hypothetical protein